MNLSWFTVVVGFFGALWLLTVAVRRRGQHPHLSVKGPADPLVSLSACEMAQMVRTGQVSARALMKAHVDRSNDVAPSISAVVADRYEAALDEAAAADVLLAECGKTPGAVATLPPFHGVPLSVKEAFAVTGMPNTSGLLHRRGTVASDDAPVVHNLRRAGFVPFCVTNTSEACMWMESSNLVYGRTNNPHCLVRTPGGSSGGEAALIAARASPVGVGSDVGGSIRMPAFFCGVFGHKPSARLVDNTGQYPNAEGEAVNMLSTGPLVRHARDLWPVLSAMCGGPERMLAVTGNSFTPDDVSLDQVVVYSCRLGFKGSGLPGLGPDREIQDGMARVEAALRERGAAVVEDFDSLPVSSVDALQQWAAVMAQARPSPFSVILGNGRDISVLWHCFLWLAGAVVWLVTGGSSFPWARHTLPALGLGLVERVEDRTPALKRQRERFAGPERDNTRRLIEKLLAPGAIRVAGDAEGRVRTRAVILFPSHRSPAPRHDYALWPPYAWIWTGVFNTLGLPVTQVPLADLSKKNGLPLGVQIVGGSGMDFLTIAVANSLKGICESPKLAQ